MAAANGSPPLLIVGRIFSGLGVGMASITSPLYISEASPAKIRGALVSINGFLMTGGHFLSYLTNLTFAKAPGAWRWMLGVAGLLALIHFVLMLRLPESPRWLYRKGRHEEAKAILRKVHSDNEVEYEMHALKESVEAEMEAEGSSGNISYADVWKTKTIRRGLIAGVGLQVFQQFVGITAVMHYSPALVQLAGIESNETAILISLVTSGLNAFATIISTYFIVNRTGRKKLLIISLCGVILSLGLLSAIFHDTSTHSPSLTPTVTSQFKNYTCPDYSSAVNANGWNCMKCLKASSPSCGFCASNTNKLRAGECLISNETVKDMCQGQDRLWYTRGCPSKTGWLALVGLALYIIFFSPGMGTVPWIVNSEIYPLKYRGICGRIAATTNWISKLIVAQSFPTLTNAIGTSWTFLIFGVISVVALFFVLIYVPETKGLPIEEVEKILELNKERQKNCNKKAPVASLNQQDNQIRESFGKISKKINIISKIQVSIPQKNKEKPDNTREKLPVVAFDRIFELVTCRFLDGGHLRWWCGWRSAAAVLGGGSWMEAEGEGGESIV
ncbi:hypothetical protein FH972_016154 [Carpinus fangiana]|uniref:Major facilitator superfamily (MFS) profile domain-containing protein n=1 Tax=Carpinus fangiana TaxID=176857 RepID=A0A5N6RFA0_9ROSI|nr:hypothetical protein FH972_016154 [Carpinus fangiana]